MKEGRDTQAAGRICHSSFYNLFTQPKGMVRGAKEAVPPGLARDKSGLLNSEWSTRRLNGDLRPRISWY